MACYIASTSGVATLEDFSSFGYPKPLVFQAKRKVEMEEKKRNIRIDQDGTRHAPIPLWQELPQITVRLEEGHATYRFTGNFDGKHTLPEKAVKLADEQKGVWFYDPQQPCIGRLPTEYGGKYYEAVW